MVLHFPITSVFCNTIYSIFILVVFMFVLNCFPVHNNIMAVFILAFAIKRPKYYLNFELLYDLYVSLHICVELYSDFKPIVLNYNSFNFHDFHN